VRLRRRGRVAWNRAGLFAAGLALIAVALASPLEEAAGERLWAHMLEHVLVGDAAPALLLVALRGPLLFFLLPPQLLAPLAGFRPLRVALGFLLRPKVSVGVWAIVLGVWHVPAVYELALRHELVHVLEHATFAAAGLLVWSQLVDPARRGELTRAGRVAVAVVLFTCGQALANVLIFSFQPLYPTYSDIGDQQLAGLVMMAEQALTLGTCVTLLVFWPRHERLHREAPRESAKAA
jgi:cytochrome c oxidase assembly factor CtaG